VEPKMASCSCCTLKVSLILFVVSVAFFIVAFAIAFKVFDDVIYSEVNKAVRLEEDTEQYDRFIELPFPVDFKVYLFNVENPDEIISGTAKPNLTEVGPFVYKQHRKKTVLNTNSEEDTISYTQLETFEFDTDASAPLTEDEVITVLNPALMSMYQVAEEFFMAGAVDQCTKSTFPAGYETLFITVPVRDLLFKGYNFCKNDGDDLCALVNDIVCKIGSTKRNIDILEDLSLQFSFLNYKQREPDGKYTVKRGMDDITTLGHIDAWNNMKFTQYWGESTTCSEVKGTDSTLYPPRVTEDNAFYIFATDICRFVEITYKGEETYKDIDGYLFGTSKETLRSTQENPEDDCYCSKLSKDETGTKSCFLDGIIDMQTCFGVPVLFSFPHFLWADEKYANGVEGMAPNEDIHKTYLVVEPNTGTPLKGVKRIQLNVAMRPVTGVKSMLQATRAIMPLLWIEEGVALTDEYVDKLRSSYFDKVNLVDGFKWALVVISSLLLVVSGGFVIWKKFFQQS
jgi:hypothetical protein